ncbi:DKNYY domain-containing protein [Muribaculum sp.]|uniref:DKNYY domain-containing protein n=1 Tax=Muribaculum sp. TaxID=1918611 RepID=UPI003529496B
MLRDGYACDAWNVYFNGDKIKGASPERFRILRDGYAEDGRNTYYLGRKVSRR